MTENPGPGPVYRRRGDTGRLSGLADAGVGVVAYHPGDGHLGRQPVQRATPAVTACPDSRLGHIQAPADKGHRRVRQPANFAHPPVGPFREGV